MEVSKIPGRAKHAEYTLPILLLLATSDQSGFAHYHNRNGAEQLLGNGDMLFMPPRSARLIRVHRATRDAEWIKSVAFSPDGI
jgi:DNA segregation ATPase FtsK/SpoIIIE-like protein